MTVAGQAGFNYNYDNANRLTQISQGSAAVSFAYDSSNRRTSLTLPNGIVMSYGYDNASQLTGITYANGSTTLGTLTYAYDLAGRRTQMGGSYAQIGLPLGVSEAEYNANNQLTEWGTASLFYDANGNMTSDGVNSFNWNARSQMSSMNSSSVSFQYDPYGRRAGKTAAGVTTNYLYDGANIAQEISGGSPIANLLSGGIDEAFTRTDSSGTADFLTDGLGTTINLTNSSGSSLAQYAYEPFGNTTVTSGSSTNSYEYTGRENDGTGLYFYRARYYSPTLQRFVSEDPLGNEGSGPNLYRYAGNNPLSFVDPLGLTTWPTSYPVVTSPFGDPIGRSSPHNGDDIRNPVGSPVYSTDNGTVIAIYNNNLGGNQILIMNADGSVSGYAHTGPTSGLAVNQPVNEGDVIGFTDKSGNETGPHLHFTYRPCATCDRIDPQDYLPPTSWTRPDAPPTSGRKDASQ
jgi:RHS repeat-associated protein